jgi:hypothetical protein
MKWIPLACAAAAVLAGCGGGGGGTGGGPGSVSRGTMRADGSGGVASLNANVTGASADARTVHIYGDQRTGPINDYSSSHRLTLVLYRPVAPANYPVAATQASGTSAATYVETARNGSSYVTTGIWQATGGSITVNKADGSHVEGTYALTMRNSSTGGVFTFQNGAFNISYESPPPPTG